MAQKQPVQQQNQQELETLQQYQMKLQMLDRQMRQVQENLVHLNKQTADLMMVEQSLEDLKKVEIGKEILVPLSSGIFVKAELKNNKELLVNVGGNTTVERSVDETKKMITDQREEIKKFEKEMQNQLQKLAQEAIGIESEIINSQK